MSPRLFTIETARAMLRERRADGHKGTFGTALLICGSEAMGGCAALAAKACLRSGAGKVVVHVPASLRTIVMIAVPEAVLSIDADITGQRFTMPPAGQFQAVGIGPGLGCDTATGRAVADELHQCTDTPHVIDADALNLLARSADWPQRMSPAFVLTPHLGELARLAGAVVSEAEHMETAARLSTMCGAVIVAKGHPTHTALPDGDVVTNTTGSDAIATAGSGDVLTGIITGLLAQGYPPEEAAPLGVFLHGLAGDIAARRLGHHSVIASDITEHLPQAFLSVTAP
ncbi:MAG: NAD(P)H-hydrate dehydratase [Bacteroidaceae bacterium]|nr:NAD(P)H-hydrate dehydratase [Bacteroidaceae bacterium]